MNILYHDRDMVVAVKPNGVLSTDEPGGMPDRIRAELGLENVRTVHRLDQVVGGLMVFATRAKAASELSRQIREGEFRKEYLAVVRGEPEEEGTLRHWLLRNKEERKSYVVDEFQPGAQEAVLHYWVLGRREGMSLVRIRLETGRTHQIRAQFSGQGMPLVGDKKYGAGEDCDIALWSCHLGFQHPYSGKRVEFSREPPRVWPWSCFDYSIE